ncbi:uncharacterized protein LOC124119903 [Haliotis rufescens]|uniref:uncharacterized protein LOC124119903 n=1 Tax=Haliotis rufescens TaxID=6454 RepID=UPI00201EFD4B|nr:uncharacterized protein LOC124119903 [Haliotis rufescens]
MTGATTWLMLTAAVMGVALAVDLTMSPGADGKVVVDAVIDRIRSKCIFGDDRLFLRRLAYVETSDGEDSITYRGGYHGGVWQIDEDKFNLTRTCSNYIRDECDVIESEFNIDWRNATWEDLRKPLYSGLAASLYIKYRSGSRDTPADITSQASFWTRYMRTGGNRAAFVTKARNLPGMDCKTELDLAFIIDGSGSVSSTNFRRMLAFINDVIDDLNIDDDEIHVAALEFSTVVGDIITFDSFTTKAALTSSISRIRKGSSGTRTDRAIQEAGATLFNTTTGARPHAKRVAILLTDGASSARQLTVAAAQTARDQGITFFSVGVGNVNDVELANIASSPNCTHVFILNNFLEIDSLLYQLKDSSCSAPKIISDTDISVVKVLPENQTVTDIYVAQVPTGSSGSNGSTTTTSDGDQNQVTVLRSEVHCGSLEIYASYNTPRPGPAFFDMRDNAREGRPSVIYLNTTRQGRPLYVTVIGSRVPVSAADVTRCAHASYNVSITTAPTRVEVVCRVGQTERTCTEGDLRESRYNNLLCQDTWNHVTNPCRTGVVSTHPHPSDLTKFIRCDVTGKMYITQCPSNETYNENTESCGHEALGGGNSSRLPSNVQDVCTAANLARGQFYFPYQSDQSKYVQCDVWGRAWVKPCPDGLTWNDHHSTCSHASAATSTSDPCNSTNNGQRFPHSEASKFISCAHGNGVVMSCPAGLVFNDQIKACDWPQGR